MENGKQIRVLLAMAAVFCALIICYNLFFVKEPAETILVTDVGTAASELERGSASADESTAVADSSVAVEKININTATAAELQALPRIGPTLSQRIVDYREEHGSFTAIEEIMNVSGIGEKTFAEIQNQIEVD